MQGTGIVGQTPKVTLFEIDFLVVEPVACRVLAHLGIWRLSNNDHEQAGRRFVTFQMSEVPEFDLLDELSSLCCIRSFQVSNLGQTNPEIDWAEIIPCKRVEGSTMVEAPGGAA